MSTLLLEFWTEKHDFCIYAEAENYEKEITLQGQAHTIVAQFNTIYEILEEKKAQQEKVLDDLLHALSERLLTPFVAS